MDVKCLDMNANRLDVNAEPLYRDINHLDMGIKRLDVDANCLGFGFTSGLSGKAILIR